MVSRSTGTGDASRPSSSEAARRGVLEREHDLEDRLVAGLAGRRQLLHEALEGQVLVGERGERAIANLLQQLGAGGGRGEVGAHHQGVGEEADQRLELDAAAVGDRRADQHRVLPRVAVQEGLEGGQQRHEDGDALAAGELADGGRELGVELERELAAPEPLRPTDGAGPRAGGAGGERPRAPRASDRARAASASPVSHSRCQTA